jgi:hypothetical protein
VDAPFARCAAGASGAAGATRLLRWYVQTHSVPGQFDATLDGLWLVVPLLVTALLAMALVTRGSGAALAVVSWGNFSLSQEGLSITISPSWSMVAWGLAISASVGVLAGLVPAIRAGRREIASCFRAV